MYFLISKTIGIFAVPSNAIMGLALCGLLLWPTMVQNWKTGRHRQHIASVDCGCIAVGHRTAFAIGKPVSAVARFARRADRNNRTRRRRRPRSLPQARRRSLGQAAERLLAAVDLYRRYPTARIVFTGGSGNVVFGGPPESGMAARFLQSLGVPRERIEVESRSRNTMENAVNTKRLVEPKPGERWLLITSAAHMPRAMGLFREAGFFVEAYPVDWQTGGWRDIATQSLSLLGGFVHLDNAAHEWVGLVVDRINGRTSTLFPGP